MKQTLKYSIQFLLISSVTFIGLVMATASPAAYDYYEVPSIDSPTNGQKVKEDTLKFPIKDRISDKLSEDPGSSFDLKDPKNIQTEIDYNAVDSNYSITEKIGKEYYRAPTYMTFEEFMKYQASKDEEAYFKKRANTLKQISKKSGGVIPKVNLGNALFDRIFGSGGIEVKPQGNVDMFFGGNWQNIKNPALVQSAQKYGIFDFDMNMNINLLAKVGDKMKLNFNYNTKATFDFENQLKLEYAGQDDDIIKKIEAGHISFPLKTSLIQGVQSLFGIKTTLQFGRLRVSAVASQQKSKKESFSVKGGAQTQTFSIPCDAYEDFKHFLLAQSFRKSFNKSLINYPVIQSLNHINRIEVWVTNKNGSADNARDVIAFQDLGETEPFKTGFYKPSNGQCDNNANTLYSQLVQSPGSRDIGRVVSAAQSLGLSGSDFEQTFARKLNPSEFTFNPELGFVSINGQLQPDDVLGVAFEYTNNGKVYKVGEFAQDLPPDSSNPKVLFLKLLKSTSPNPTVPIWKLMMKNVYSLGASGISAEDFILNVMYLDPGGGEKRYLPDGPKAGIPLLTLLNLDRLNSQNDPQPDGRFDFVEGLTINSQQGRVMFPVLEPFGDDLKPVFNGDIALEKKYLYKLLYDSTKNVAMQFPQFNRYLLKGTFKAANAAEIYLGGFNIPQGSVSVFAGGQKLTENQDYQIDYGIGKLKILNAGILSSGIPINVSYENNATFGAQVQNFMGTRLDYFINDNFSVGGTMLRLTERPYFNKVTFGEDPIKNTVLGLDANYQSEIPKLTRMVDALPIVATTAPSMLVARGEVAKIIPGHSKFINDANGEASIYVDDFEGTRSSYDLKFPIMSWSLASTPKDATDKLGNILFPEASLVNDLNYGKNRAKIAWYNLDPCLADPRQNCMPAHLKADTAQLNNHYVRLIQQTDVFPQRSTTALQGNLTTLDLFFDPKVKGPYNYDATDINVDGQLLHPEKRWGGIMRAIDYSDFETANVEFIEFWVMDPYIRRSGKNGDPLSNGGSLYINLGNVSEDILKDSRKFFENGLPYPADPSKVEKTNWSFIPKFQQQLTPAFDNNTDARALQDVGYDGMNDADETIQFQNYLNDLKANFGATSKAYLTAVNDPSNDDYHHFRGSDYDNSATSILNRYSKYNNPQGNSPVTTNTAQYSDAYTNIPESEDINRDNTLNQNEQYFQYRIDIKPNMQKGDNYITNIQRSTVKLSTGRTEEEIWYQFKVPIKEFTSRVGGIADFKSIRFMRMFMNGFQDSVMLRFSRLELGRNTWRKYNYSLKNPGEIVPEVDDNATTFNVTSVSIEENSSRQPIPYFSPPGIQRQQQQVSNGQNVLQNEQALSLYVCNLEDGDAKGTFKSLGMDLRQFKSMKMFVHAENGETSPIKKGDLRAFIRLGSDFVSNYYEYEIPLTFTPWSTRNPDLIWPAENDMDLNFADLVTVKTERNATGASYAIPFEKVDSKGNIIRIIGNPNLGDVKMAMLGVMNPKKTINTPTDDGSKKCAEVWFNELRLSNLDESGGYAAMGSIDLQLADVANIKASGSMHTAGYGNIDQKVNQRARENYNQFDVSTTLNVGKFMPKNWGVQLPVFAGYSQTASNPIYDPYDLDVKLQDKLSAYNGKQQDSVKKAAQDFTSIKSINFQNVKISPTHNKHKDPWDLQNFDLSYSYTQTKKHNPLVEKDQLDEHHASLGYTFAPKQKPIEPFKKLIPQKRKYFALIRDFNFNLFPSNFTFRNVLSRSVGETHVRNIDEGAYPIAPNYFKFFTWNRDYKLRWDLTKSLSFDFGANNNSRIDEPFGRLDTKEKKDTFWNNVSKLGRTVGYTQNINANYALPLSKFPLLDWTTLRGSYGATYIWTSASLLAKNLGNTIGNTQNKQVNGDFNFNQLYNKVKILKKINTPKSSSSGGKNTKSETDTKGGKMGGMKGGEKGGDKSGGGDRGGMIEKEFAGGGRDKGSGRDIETNNDIKKEQDNGKDSGKDAGSIGKGKGFDPNDKNGIGATGKNGKDSLKSGSGKIGIGKAGTKGKSNVKKKKDFVPSDGLRVVGKLFMMVKRASFSYNETQGTTLPGYMDSTQYLGMNFKNSANPDLFAFGYQPNRLWLEGKGKDNILTRDSLFNAPFTQQYTQTLNITANLEPIQDFKIDLNLSKTFNKGHSELYKDTVGGNNDYVHLNPYENGGFSISYMAMSTMFERTKQGELSHAFDNFESNRKIISARLGLINPYTGSAAAPEDPEYTKGYTRYSQEVIIPAFLSAYTGKDPKTYPLLANNNETIKSNPFRNILPKPNWRISYNGLSRTKMFKDIFQSFTLNHSYTGNLSMNSFTSSLMYKDVYALGFPSFIDSVSHNYIPYFSVPNITITEAFGPLLGIDATFKSSLNLHVEYKKARTLSMSLVDFQLSETKSKEISFGGGIRLKNVTIPTRYFGLNKMKSDVNIKADFGLRDDRTSINRLDQHVTRDTRGQKVITISPSIDYILSQTVTLRFFYDRRQSIPYVSNAYPITTTRGGVMIRFMLGQ